MTKEEQIEEMTNVMFGKAMAKLEDFPTVDYIVFSDYEKYELRQKIKGALNLYAGALYESGYRKADEVRAETAREIVKKYKEAFEVIREEREINKTAFDFLYDDISDEILNDYGVEVE